MDNVEKNPLYSRKSKKLKRNSEKKTVNGNLIKVKISKLKRIPSKLGL